MGATGATSRVRLTLEGGGSLALPGERSLAPTLEAGLRYDGGDAETGVGLEVGGGLRCRLVSVCPKIPIYLNGNVKG